MRSETRVRPWQKHARAISITIIVLLALVGMGVYHYSTGRSSVISATQYYLAALNSRNSDRIRATYCDPNHFIDAISGPEPLTLWQQDLAHTTYKVTWFGLRSAVTEYQGPLTTAVGNSAPQTSQSSGRLIWYPRGLGWCFASI